MIHVKMYEGGVARLVDMQNAGKRGKTCRVLSVNGWFNTTCGQSDTHPEAALAHRQTGRLMAYLSKLATGELSSYRVDQVVEADFDKVRQDLLAIAADQPSSHVRIVDEQLKGIDAPKPKLLAGVSGKWSAMADERGIHLSDLEDHHNEPRMITDHRQTDSRAYQIAAKVWDKVRQAATFHAAADVLVAAGARLHYYCAMD